MESKNVTNMSSMFYGCRSLKSLPNISKWDTKKVTLMNSMFYDCDPNIIPIKFKN
jgi:surface protein